MKVDNKDTSSESNKSVDIDRNNFFRNLAGYNDIEAYTIAGLKDEVYLSMIYSKVTITDNSGKKVVMCKYFLQAWKLQGLISVGQPPPCFVIQLSDLNPNLKQALTDLDDKTRNFVLNQAIGMIFENINPKLYALSIARRLCWRFEP